jgi:hypothetical protein
MASRRSAALSVAILSTALAWPHCVQGGEILTMRVTPRQAVAPAFIRVIANVESHEDNRALEVMAESPDFFRSSRLVLNGTRAARRQIVDFTNLPEGDYMITATVQGAWSTRAVASQPVKVVR